MTKDEIDASGAPHSGISNPLREAVAEAIRRYCRSKSSEVVQISSDGIERIYYAGLSLPDLTDAVFTSLQSVQPPAGEGLREALDELQSAELIYRMCHDLDGDGHMNTGRAWDKLRQAGARARSLLAALPPVSGDGR